MTTDKDTTCSALPNFLLIGVAKAGTSWIFETLREHPDIFVPIAKDLMFFDKYYHKGKNWYQSFFTGCSNEKAIGELSHDYYLSGQTAQRIHEMLPHVKIIICLREPVDKLISGYRYNLTTEFGKELTFEQYANLPELIEQTSYYEKLKKYYEIFNKNNILVLFYERLQKNPKQFVRDIYTFLEVDPDFEPPSLHLRINPGHDARIMWIAHTVYKAAGIMRSLGLVNLVGAIKRSKIFSWILYKKSRLDIAISQKNKELMFHQLHKNNAALEKLIGHPLPEEWYWNDS